jgi:hypothetical protein
MSIALRRYVSAASESKRPFPLGLAKHIAVGALFLIAKDGRDTGTALRAAQRAFEGSDEANLRTIKKCKSEADALVQYVLAKGLGQDDAYGAMPAPKLLEQFEDLMDGIRLADAVALRARELRGAKGGRPARTVGAVQAVKDVLLRAERGDGSAQDEVMEIRRLLGEFLTRDG